MDEEDAREYYETHMLIGASDRLNRVTREMLLIMAANLQSWRWAAQHWVATHLCGLRFCHSCSGYFHEVSMVSPDKCEACEVSYIRDYGISME